MQPFSYLNIIQTPSAAVVLDKRTGEVIMRRFQETLGLNPVVQISGVSEERLRVALMMFDNSHQVVGYSIDQDKKTLVFYHCPDEKMIPFPFKADINGVTEFINRWLDSVAYPKQPHNPNGENEKGWLVWCDAGGRIEGFGDCSFVAVKPYWVMFPKEEENAEADKKKS